MSSYTEGLHITDNPACNEFMRGEWGNFPRIQFDRKLGAELAPGETIDVAKKRLKEYLKYAGIPRDRWGDLSIVVTGAESSLYLRNRELGHAAINKTDSQGLDVVVKTGYCIDSDATLRHELCHVKDAIDGKIDLQRTDLLYRLGASINRKDLRIQAAALNTLGALAYVCGMYFNSEELKEAAISVLALNNVLAAALLGIHLKGYYHNPCEERAREAEKKGEWLPYAFVRRISAEFENEIAPFLSHPWTLVQTGGDDHKVWAMQEAATRLGLSCYTTTDPEKVEMLAKKEAERTCCGYAKSARSAAPVRSRSIVEVIDKKVDRFMARADTAIRNGGAVIAVVPDSIRSIGLEEFGKRYHDIEKGYY